MLFLGRLKVEIDFGAAIGGDAAGGVRLVDRLAVGRRLGKLAHLVPLGAIVATWALAMSLAIPALTGGLGEAGASMPLFTWIASGDLHFGLDVLKVDRFIKICRTHLAIEDSNLYPLAAMLLSRQDLEALGEAMAQRRAASRA